jgi:hypothetical protein
MITTLSQSHLRRATLPEPLLCLSLWVPLALQRQPQPDLHRPSLLLLSCSGHLAMQMETPCLLLSRLLTQAFAAVWYHQR